MQTVPDRQHHHLHPAVGQDFLVELLDGPGVGIRAGLEDPAMQEGVVHQDHPARPDPRHQFPPVAEVAALVGVDEGQVDPPARRQRAQRVQRRAEPELDTVRQARLLPVGARQRRPLLVDVAAQQRPAVGQAAGQAQCGVAGEGADLDHLAGAHEAGQHRHERALLRADLEDHPVREAGGGLRDQVAQQRVRRAGVGDQILVQVRAQVLGSGGHGVDVSARVR